MCNESHIKDFKQTIQQVRRWDGTWEKHRVKERTWHRQAGYSYCQSLWASEAALRKSMLFKQYLCYLAVHHGDQNTWQKQLKRQRTFCCCRSWFLSNVAGRAWWSPLLTGQWLWSRERQCLLSGLFPFLLFILPKAQIVACCCHIQECFLPLALSSLETSPRYRQKYALLASLVLLNPGHLAIKISYHYAIGTFIW